MYKDVERYITSCNVCQKTKVEQNHPSSLLQPLPIPSTPWESVSLNLIVHLPTTKRGHTAIVVFVDRLTKMAHFVATTTTIDAPGVAQLFFNEVVRHHGYPANLVSDRDARFTSKFWQTLAKLSGIELRMSTAFHPQTDGETERTNRTLEQMLRAYVNYAMDNWDNMLPYAEFAYNNSKSASTQITPLHANLGRHP